MYIKWFALSLFLVIGDFQTITCYNTQTKHLQKQHPPQHPQQQEQGNKEEHVPCVARHFKSTSFVCVCNATYCDSFPPPVAPARGGFLVVTSDMSTSRFSPAMGQFVPLEDEVDDETHADRRDSTVAEATFLLTNEKRQAILGWGASITDSATLNLLSLSDNTQDQLLRSYYTPGGLEYTMGRINMGGCDFSTRGYTYADTPDDVDLEYFALQPEDLDYKIPVLHRINELLEEPLQVVASPWSAPAWMKTSNSLTGRGRLMDHFYQTYAQYFIKFLDAYSSHNLTMWGLTSQNEPLDGRIPFFPFNCMGWTAGQQRRFIGEHLGPLLEDQGYGDIKLMVMDDQRLNLPHWPQEVLNNSDAARYVSGVAVHWYADDVTDPQRLTETHDVFPHLFLLATEASTGTKIFEDDVILGSWERLEAYANDIIEDLEHWVNGWIDWNICLDMDGGPNWSNYNLDSTIIVNAEEDEFYKNPMYFAMGHFSKFIRPLAENLRLLSDDPHGLQTTAFQNPDGTTAIVILNEQDFAVDVAINVGDRGILKTTAESRSLNSILYK